MTNDGKFMQVTMIAPFGEMKFTVPQGKATALIQQAVQYASGQEPEEREEPQDATPEPPKAPQTIGRPHSRVERMFGDFKAGAQPEQHKDGDHPETAQQAGLSTYKGFLLIKCEHCGEVKGFCTKIPASRSTCSKCGKITALRDLKPLYLKCKFGREFKYRTNMAAEAFDYPCLNCGSPVDLELNKCGDAYVTVSD